MKRRTSEQWQVLFAEHEHSGLTAAAFCRERGLCPKYFSLRRRQLDAREVKKASVFVPITTSSVSSAALIEIQLGSDVQLRVPTAVSARWLGELLHQLKV